MRPRRIPAGFEDEACGAWHLERPTPGPGWRCECGDAHLGEIPEPRPAIPGSGPRDWIVTFDPIPVWFCPDDDDCGTPNPPEIVEVFQFDCGRIVVGEPEMVEAWRCSRCGSIYPDKQEARECCR